MESEEEKRVDLLQTELLQKKHENQRLQENFKKNFTLFLQNFHIFSSKFSHFFIQNLHSFCPKF